MTHRIIMTAGAVVAAGFIVGSAVANFIFGLSLGRTMSEGILIGSIGVCAVATNALCPFFLSWFIEASRRAAATAIILLYLVCLIYSATSAVGFVAQNREGVSTTRQMTRDIYDDTRRELLDLEGRRENAKGKQRIRLEAKIDEARKRLASARNASPVPVDAQSAFLSLLTFGLLDPAHIRLALATLFALMVELGATIGLFAALSHPTKKSTPAALIDRWRPRSA